MFNFKNSVIEFLNQKPSTYKYHLKMFEDFVKSKRIDESLFKEFFQGLRTEVIIESLDYYIKKTGISARGRADHYTSAVKEYFSFLFYKNYISNSEFEREIYLPTHDESSFRYKINNFIRHHASLKEEDGFDILEWHEVKRLIQVCDETMISKEIIDKAVNMQKYYNKFRSALLIKLISLTGMKYENICNIKPEDLNLTYNSIKINGLTLSLPNNLRDQFERYEHINKEIGAEKERATLFIEFDKSVLSSNTSTTANFLKTVNERGDLNGLIKYVVVQMMKEGISEVIIKELTGIKEKMYDDCKQYFSNDITTLNRVLNSRLRNMEIFDLL
ncbi:hypothetical protein P4S95_16260 [Aneurinibacillus aneurinilyticus]|uniref:hypothetical protein n=1 Tax=Aneurinibacillus aneurinilyticus TaxID=1391 RepID=UPI002E21EADB|nr:hypothetical protein [Aneurinibacillus aneurinilyticus]